MTIRQAIKSTIILLNLVIGNALPVNAEIYRKEAQFSPAIIAHYDVDELEAVEKKIQEDPNNAEAYLKRGLIRSHSQEDFTGAIDDFTRVIHLQPNAEVYNYRGTAYFWLKQYPKALDDYNEAIALNPNFAIAYYNRAYVYLELKQKTEAITDFRQGAALSQQQGDMLSYQQALELIQVLETGKEN